MKLKEKQKAIFLRKKGFSINEIVRKVPVSKSTVSLWLNSVVISKQAQKRIESLFTKGQIASQKAKRAQTAQKEAEAIALAKSNLEGICFDKNISRLLCAMIYYCEGSKSVGDVRFTNSDPRLVGFFLRLFRESFNIDEAKFRVCVHLHSYHKKDTQLKFWSKISNIPLQQFIKPFQKKHSGLYKKEGYQGCVSVRYGSAKIARELKAIALTYMDK